MNEHSLSRRRANFIAYASAGLIMVVCLLGHLGAIGLVGPDEPRYAWIARAGSRVSHGLRSRCFTTGRLGWDFWLTCRPSGRRVCLPPLRRLRQPLR